MVNVSDEMNTARIAFRVPADMEDRIQQMAGYHGRSKSAELRHAWSHFDACSALAYLDTPEAEAEIGDKVEEARTRLRTEIADMADMFFRPRPVFPIAEAVAPSQRGTET